MLGFSFRKVSVSEIKKKIRCSLYVSPGYTESINTALTHKIYHVLQVSNILNLKELNNFIIGLK